MTAKIENRQLPLNWNGVPYHSLNQELRNQFGGKVYKLSLQSGCTCPNRDGTIGTGGCAFCSEGGSGDFTQPSCLPVSQQIGQAKALISSKLPRTGFAGYFAYFQSFTNTYAPVRYLEPLFEEAIRPSEILGLSVGTRPDCLPQEVIALLSRLNQQKPVWVELGLQTIHEKTAEKIHRGYSLPVFKDAVIRLKQAGLPVVVHLILGLPGESREEMIQSVNYLAHFRDFIAANPCGAPVLPSGEGLQIDGIKLQLLHILRGTELGRIWQSAADSGMPDPDPFTLPEYADFLIDLIELLPPEMTVHRLTGDPPKKLLLAPSWSADKKKVLNTISRRFRERGTWQGRRWTP